MLWLFGGKRLVRLHLEEGKGVPFSTMEGILVGRRSGHYVLLRPGIVEAEDRVVPLDGVAEVPKERVIFVQVLKT
jgi:hypothetical protein